MPKRLPTIEQVLTLFAAPPTRLEALSACVTTAQLHAPPKNDEWSANDVLAHLRACADVRGSCILAIIAEDMPTVRAVYPSTWIKPADYREQEFRPSLSAFTAQRTGLLAVLEPLSSKGWSRRATVTGAGKILERTVLFYADCSFAMNGRTAGRSNASSARCLCDADIPNLGIMLR
jgi:hypothetical protein